MKKSIIIMSLFLFSILLHAHESKAEVNSADFIGIGYVKAMADFVTFNITVQSECYAKPIDAQKATDEVVLKAYDYLKTLKKDNDKYFRVVIEGGYTTNFSKWYDKTEYCKNTFQKSSTITIKMAAREDFDKSFAAIQTHILENFDQGYLVNAYEGPRSYVTMTQPSPQLSRENRKTLDLQALSDAMLDAKARFRAATKSCREHQWKITKIQEDGISVSPEPPRYFAKSMAFEAAAPAQDAAAPVQFDELTVEKRLRVSFQFEGALCYEAAKL